MSGHYSDEVLGLMMAAIDRQSLIDRTPCRLCGGDRLRTDFTDAKRCHAPLPDEPTEVSEVFMTPIDVPDWDTYFLDIADTVATRVRCTRRRVGAVLVLDHRIIATGYNGAPAGDPHCDTGGCPRGRMDYSQVAPMDDYDQPGSPGFCTAVHAEANALLHAVRDTRGATMYITDEPCPGCRKLLAAAGVRNTIWRTGS